MIARRLAPKRASEDQEQAALFKWADLAARQQPELTWLFHIPNGGQRHPIVAARLKAQGVRPGVPDLLLPVRRLHWLGLWIEMKAHNGRLSDDQEDWIYFLRDQGYKAEVCFGWESAREVILAYLNPPVTYSPGVI